MKNLFFLIAILLLPTSIGQAQQVADNYYGQGITSYFSGNSQCAMSSLNSAIALNPNDARYYYFRGLAQRLSGNSMASDSDFQMGASLEARAGNRPSSKVNRALEKVQGCLRLHIEEIRRQAMKAKELERLNPSQMMPQNYSQPVYPSNSFQVVPGSIIEVAPSTNGFVVEPESNVVEPNQTQPEAKSGDSMETTPPAEESDPFGQPAEEATDTPAPTEDNSGEANPFGSEAPADNSPFGNEAEAGPVPDTEGSPFGNEVDGGDAGGGDAGTGVIDDPFSGN